MLACSRSQTEAIPIFVPAADGLKEKPLRLFGRRKPFWSGPGDQPGVVPHMLSRSYINRIAPASIAARCPSSDSHGRFLLSG
jgi:hypothetical protein